MLLRLIGSNPKNCFFALVLNQFPHIPHIPVRVPAIMSNKR
jgi:hypothetical protein